MQKPKIFIDFDKTISPIHGFNEPPDKETKQAILLLSTKYHIAIYSCRANKDICNESDYFQLIEYLKYYSIPYDEIVMNKPLYVAIIDDKAFNPNITSWEQITNELIGKDL